MGAHQGLVRQHPAAARPTNRRQLRLPPPHRPLRPLRRPARHLREQPHHHQLRRRPPPRRHPRPQHHPLLRPRSRRRHHPQQLPRPARPQPGRRLRQPQPPRAQPLLSLPRSPRRDPLGNGTMSSPPRIAAAYTLTRTIRLRASAGHGFRLPTYVDLYYSDPTTIGNPNLKPESSWSYEAGLDWTPTNGRLTLTATAFRLQQKDTIDYSKLVLATDALTFAEPYQAVNIQNLNITGAESHPAHPSHRHPAAPVQLHRRPRRLPTAQPHLRVRLQLRRPKRPLRLERPTSTSSPPTPRSTSSSAPSTPPTRSGMSRSPATPAICAPTCACEPQQHRLSGDPRRPPARPHHHGRHRVQLVRDTGH